MHIGFIHKEEDAPEVLATSLVSSLVVKPSPTSIKLKKQKMIDSFVCTPSSEDSKSSMPKLVFSFIASKGLPIQLAASKELLCLLKYVADNGKYLCKHEAADFNLNCAEFLATQNERFNCTGQSFQKPVTNARFQFR
jgi:hypothetical protein